MMQKIGFMQGRLSPLVNGCIQAFPWDTWEIEFPAAAGIGLHMMEWTLDQERLYENPLMTSAGQEAIRGLCRQYDFAIPSMTGDCFMQAPFWKVDGQARADLQRDCLAIGRASAHVGIRMMVVPLVDNGRLDNLAQEDALVVFLQERSLFFAQHGLQVIFESDFPPAELARFIARLQPGLFGINYDIGNSAALGFDPIEEFAAYGSRIVNVHIKDRVLGGTTVPLGTGNANFKAVFLELAKIGYQGNYILQTARARDDDHAGALIRYRQWIEGWIEQVHIHAD